jgi:hypothetical protein
VNVNARSSQGKYIYVSFKTVVGTYYDPSQYDAITDIEVLISSTAAADDTSPSVGFVKIEQNLNEGFNLQGETVSLGKYVFLAYRKGKRAVDMPLVAVDVQVLCMTRIFFKS